MSKRVVEVGLWLVAAGLVSAPVAFGFGVALAGAGVVVLGATLVVTVLR